MQALSVNIFSQKLSSMDLQLLKANCIGLLILDNPRERSVQFITFIIRREDILES